MITNNIYPLRPRMEKVYLMYYIAPDENKFIEELTGMPYLNHSVGVNEFFANAEYESLDKIRVQLWHGPTISFRDLANNLDFDDRNNPARLEERFSFGELIMLACLMNIMDMIEEIDSQIPEVRRKLEEMDEEAMRYDFEYAYDSFTSTTESAAYDYLFGKTSQHLDEESEDNDMLRYHFCQDVIYSLLCKVAELIDNSLELYELWIGYENSYFTGRWDNEVLHICHHRQADTQPIYRGILSEKINQAKERHNHHDRRRW